MKKKIALIFGITGQDGAYLSRLLLEKNYLVHGIKRRSSSLNTSRIDDIYVDPHKKSCFFLHYGDVTDSLAVLKNISAIKPDEIYNLAAQSHVGVSFEIPEYTANVDAIGTLRILEAIKSLNLDKKIKFYQAGTSEMFGASKPPQSEKTNFYPRSPYGVAKLYAHWITINYREAYNIFASNGILFNHESPIRGKEFVTRKITDGVAKIKMGLADKITLGNLDSKRDWGFAGDFVEAMWLMLQQPDPDDYVISTGIQHSIRDVLNIAFNEVGISDWEHYIESDPRFKRPAELYSLCGDMSKAKNKLNWSPKTTFEDMIKAMINADIERYSK